MPIEVNNFESLLKIIMRGVETEICAENIEVNAEQFKTICILLEANTVIKSLDIFAMRSAKVKNYASFIAKMLQRNTTLTEIDLSSNQFSIEDAKLLAQAFKKNKSLKKVSLAGNQITSNIIQIYVEGLRHNTSIKELDLSNNKIDANAAKELAELFKANTTFDKVNKTIEKMNLAQNSIDDVGAIAIMQALDKNITSLNLWGNKIGDDSITVLAEILQKNTSIIYLDLSFNKFNANKIQTLLHSLKENKTIQQLKFNGNKLSLDSIKLLAEEVIKNNSTITTLFLSNCEFGSIDIRHLAEALAVNKTLKSLNLSQNDIDDEGVIILSEKLAINSNISDIQLNEIKVGINGIKSFAKLLMNNKQLTSVSLCGNGLNEEQAELLAEGLKLNKSITDLTLAKNCIGDKGVIVLADVLAGNAQIEKLNLAMNKIGFKGAVALGEVLKANKKIIDLALSNQFYYDHIVQKISDLKKIIKKITDASICKEQGANLKELKHIIQICKKEMTQICNQDLNNCIQGLSAYVENIMEPSSNGYRDFLRLFIQNSNEIIKRIECSIENSGYELIPIIEALTINTSIKNINFSYNKFNDKAIAALAKMLKINKTIETLNLSEVEINEVGIKLIAKALKKNNTITNIIFTPDEEDSLREEVIIAFLNKNRVIAHLKDALMQDDGINIGKVLDLIKCYKDYLTEAVSLYNELESSTFMNEDDETNNLIYNQLFINMAHLFSNYFGQTFLNKESINITGALKFIQEIEENEISGDPLRLDLFIAIDECITPKVLDKFRTMLLPCLLKGSEEAPQFLRIEKFEKHTEAVIASYLGIKYSTMEDKLSNEETLLMRCLLITKLFCSEGDKIVHSEISSIEDLKNNEVVIIDNLQKLKNQHPLCVNLLQQHHELKQKNKRMFFLFSNAVPTNSTAQNAEEISDKVNDNKMQQLFIVS